MSFGVLFFTSFYLLFNFFTVFKIINLRPNFKTSTFLIRQTFIVYNIVLYTILRSSKILRSSDFNMSFSLSFALASFGIALGKSLPSSSFKRTSKKTAFSPASGLAAASAIDFSLIDAQSNFGRISDPRSMELLGSYFLQVFNLSESSWRVHLLDRLLSFESSSV